MMVRRSVVLAAVSAAMLGLSGCGAAGGGDAATSTQFRISQQRVADDVVSVQEALGRPPAEPPVGLALANVQRLVLEQLVGGKAAELGIRVTASDVRLARADLAATFGGMDALESAALQSGVPSDQIDAAVRTNLEVTAIGSALAPDDEAQVQVAAAQQALAAFSEAIDVEVAPRYGTWDDATLSIQPGSPVAQPDVAEPVIP